MLLQAFLIAQSCVFHKPHLWFDMITGKFAGMPSCEQISVKLVKCNLQEHVPVNFNPVSQMKAAER
jgi:hypothetical protein